MPAELHLYGVYVPSFLVLMLLAYAASRVLRRLLARIGFYKLVWHRALFDLALYVHILGAASFLSRQFG